MLAVSGIYENGKIILDNKVPLRRKVKVIVTFIEEPISSELTSFRHSDFSFSHSREKTKRYKGALANTIIEDRRAEL